MKDIKRGTWHDVTGEIFRMYIFGGTTVRFDKVIKLRVSKNGGHRLVDAKGDSHYVPFKWLALTFRTETNKPRFIV